MRMQRLKNKVVVITGVASGIGKATAELFAREGAIVIGADINPGKGREVINKIQETGKEAIFVHADVSKIGDVSDLFEAAPVKKRVDVLFNNAGIELVKPLVETTEEEWDNTLKVNLKSVYLCCKHVIPIMIRQGGGSIINNASVAGLVGSFSSPYSASKGGIIALSKALAIELASDNIRVNCITPGAIETPMLERVIEKQGDPVQIRRERMKGYPMGRFGSPEEIAHTVLFLASDESSFITGSVVTIDGGFSSH
jgi:NAD(P)-dependent dehydrogenase (short-subunit alcohol dehydrogenase family)